MTSTEQNKQNREIFIAVITLGLLTLFVIACMIALYMKELTFKEFAALVAPWISLLIGYWIRGAQQ